MSKLPKITLTALTSLPEFQPGDDLAGAIAQAARQESHRWAGWTAVVIAQKVVSKVEGKLVDLRTIAPSPMALAFAHDYEKDPRLVELVFRQSRRIVKMDRGVLIAETRHGFVCANAGVDQSNVPSPDHATVLPDDPDASARKIREQLSSAVGVSCAVVICDTFGRPWRTGLANVAIGVAGMKAIEDLRGQPDRHGRILQATSLAVADELAAAAGLLMGKADGQPVVLIEGFAFKEGEGSARDLVRKAEEDLFR